MFSKHPMSGNQQRVTNLCSIWKDIGCVQNIQCLTTPNLMELNFNNEFLNISAAIRLKPLTKKDIGCFRNIRCLEIIKGV